MENAFTSPLRWTLLRNFSTFFQDNLFFLAPAGKLKRLSGLWTDGPCNFFPQSCNHWCNCHSYITKVILCKFHIGYLLWNIQCQWVCRCGTMKKEGSLIIGLSTGSHKSLVFTLNILIFCYGPWEITSFINTSISPWGN